MVESKEVMLERIERGYSALMRFVDSLDPETMLAAPGEGEWTVKDVIAHVAAWEDVLLRFHLSGEPFDEVVEVRGAKYRVTPFDEINESLFEAYHGLSQEEVREFADRTHRKLIDHLSGLNDRQLRSPAQSIIDEGLEAYALIEYIEANTIEHYAEHLAMIRNIVDLLDREGDGGHSR